MEESSDEEDKFRQALNDYEFPQKGKAKFKKPKGVPKNIPPEKKRKDKQGTKKATSKAVTTTFNPSNPKHMIDSVNLSNFKEKAFTVILFKEFADSIVDMKCLESLVL